MSRFMRGLFQTARTISTIDPTAPSRRTRRTLPQPRLERSFVQLYACASLCRIPYFLYLSHSNIFCPHFNILLDFIFSRGSHVSFSVFTPLTVLRHADRMALFQGFTVVCFLDLLTPLLVCIVRAINRLGSQPSEVGAVSTPRHLQPAVATGR